MFKSFDVPGMLQEGKEAPMSLVEEELKPVLSRMPSYQWVGLSIVLGIFFAFLDLLMIAAVLGYLHLQPPAWCAVPITFTGFFFAGWSVGRFGPSYVVWEPPVGILVCILLLLMGLARPEMTGAWAVFVLFLNWVVVPLVAMTVCYGGLRVGRGGWGNLAAKVGLRTAGTPGQEG
jgi:hypothetical protein